MHAYCLFCQTHRCHVIASLLEIKGIERALAPTIVKRQRKQGVNVDVVYDLLPGYVFIYTEEKLPDKSVTRGIDGFIRFLGDPSMGYELVHADREFAMLLYQREGVVAPVRMYKVGDHVTIDDPLFSCCDGKVVRLDERKQRACVEFSFQHNVCRTWVACDLIKLPGEAAPELQALHAADPAVRAQGAYNRPDESSGAAD